MPVAPRALAAAALVSAGLTAGWFAHGWAASEADPYAPIDTLVRAIGLVQTSYVDERPTEALVGAALRGVVHELDPHSAWLPPEAWRDAQRESDGTRAGIGVEVRFEDRGAVVTRVIPGGPAARDGVERGDVIIAIDGQPLDVSAIQAGEAFAGDRGEPVVLSLLRAGSAQELRTVRDRVRVPAVTLGTVEPGLLWARVATFQAGAGAELEAALTRAAAEGPVERLILDLRDNPGGLIEEAVAVADLFLADGPIVQIEGRVAGAQGSYAAGPGAWTGPLVVLVNGRSASAAEVVAAALQDRGRARLVGTPTFGKGTVQTVFEHRDGSALKLTVARYRTPSGQPVATREGRVPDVLVPWPGEGSAADKLRAAIEGLEVSEGTRAELTTLVDALPNAELRQVRSPIPWEAPLADRVILDPQLTAAIIEVRR